MATEAYWGLASDVKVRKEGFGLLFYRSREAKLSFFRSRDLFGTASDDKNVSFLTANLSNSKDAGRLMRALQLLFDKGLIPDKDFCCKTHNAGEMQANGQPMGPRLSNKHGLTHEIAYAELLAAPVNVTWEITRLCNLKCRHCLSAGLAEQCSTELDFSQCCRFIDDLHRMKVFQINFGGGEPFLRQDFLHILDYAHSKGITTCVSTNGTMLTEPLVKRLAGMKLLFIQVSLDGASASTNDAIRGNGTFDRIISGIEILRRHGLSNLSTNTVVTAVNFREILQIYDLGKRYGIKTRLSRFRPSGNGKDMWEKYHLTKGQLGELSGFLSAHREVLTGDSFFSITANDRQSLGLNMCGAGKMTCSVLPDGSVYPCAFLQDNAFLAGNITSESLQSIWQNAPAFNMLRKIRIEVCESCARFSLCHGGCPAVAYFLGKSLQHGDPECMMEFRNGVFVRESQNGVAEYARTV